MDWTIQCHANSKVLVYKRKCLQMWAKKLRRKGGAKVDYGVWFDSGFKKY